jgi:hypothetical protein
MRHDGGHSKSGWVIHDRWAMRLSRATSEIAQNRSELVPIRLECAFYLMRGIAQ